MTDCLSPPSGHSKVVLHQGLEWMISCCIRHLSTAPMTYKPKVCSVFSDKPLLCLCVRMNGKGNSFKSSCEALNMHWHDYCHLISQSTKIEMDWLHTVEHALCVRVSRGDLRLEKRGCLWKILRYFPNCPVCFYLRVWHKKENHTCAKKVSSFVESWDFSVFCIVIDREGECDCTVFPGQAALRTSNLLRLFLECVIAQRRV